MSGTRQHQLARAKARTTTCFTPDGTVVGYMVKHWRREPVFIRDEAEAMQFAEMHPSHDVDRGRW